ncbi:hypothetical protein GS881_24555 [Rhodococcus hoagii]|nr:hypothetical protein [Prescottella equi]
MMTWPRLGLIAGGVSALDADPGLAERFGLTTGHHEDVDGYVQASHVEALADAFGLVPT